MRTETLLRKIKREQEARNAQPEKFQIVVVAGQVITSRYSDVSYTGNNTYKTMGTDKFTTVLTPSQADRIRTEMKMFCWMHKPETIIDIEIQKCYGFVSVTLQKANKDFTDCFSSFTYKHIMIGKRGAELGKNKK